MRGSLAYATVAVSHSDFRHCRPETNDLKADIIAVRFSAAFFERQIHSVAELNGIAFQAAFRFFLMSSRVAGCLPAAIAARRLSRRASGLLITTSRENQREFVWAAVQSRPERLLYPAHQE